MTKLLLSGLACCSLLTADFNGVAWKTRRQIRLAESAPAAVSEFIVDGPLYRDSAAGLDDLRILRDGTETPYVIQVLNGTRRTLEPTAKMLNKAYVPGSGVQAILDLKGHPEHNRLRVGSDLHNFKETVRVETSDDQHTWALVQSGGLIFDVQRDDHSANETTVSYPTSTRRYVRLTIAGWSDPDNLQAVWVSAYRETGATRDVIATLTPSVHEDSKTQTTELIFDLGFGGQPFDQIDLSVDPGEFSRTVEIGATNDLRHWYANSGSVISRTAEGEQLSLTMGETTGRYLKIVVANADSAPLHFGAAKLSGVRRVVKFPSLQPGNYFVYVGNPSARQPSYDFARVLPAGKPGEASLGEPTANPLFRVPDRPWTDRNPWLLNGVLVIAVLAMGLVTMRMLKKVS